MSTEEVTEAASSSSATAPAPCSAPSSSVSSMVQHSSISCARASAKLAGSSHDRHTTLRAKAARVRGLCRDPRSRHGAARVGRRGKSASTTLPALQCRPR